MRIRDKERLLTEVTSRLEREVNPLSIERLQESLASSVYHELYRLKHDSGPEERREGTPFWKGIRDDLGKSGERELRGHHKTIVKRYSEEICGNFDERIYGVATRIAPKALGLIANPVSPLKLLGGVNSLPGFDDALVVQGAVDKLKRLKERGTLIFLPQHVSNMDSLVLGYAIYRLGLPPVIYGAGLNLFSNPLVGFFMHNLGAYTVDRRKRDPLYKRVLKEYATMTLELGYDNLFFPGGTRSRSGAIERYLKLGLAGVGVRSYVNNLKNGRASPNIYFVPVTLSFQLVLEAETLIDDFLKEVGKSRYIITDDEFSQASRVYDFMTQLMRLDSKVFATFSEPVDPFGNYVDDDGESLDPRGRRVDPSKYVVWKGEYQTLPDRDREYTRDVAERVKRAFTVDNVIQSTHVVARAMMDLFRRSNPQLDLIRLLRMGGMVSDFPISELLRELDTLMSQLRALEMASRIRLADELMHATADDIWTDAARHFQTYHQEPVLTRRGDRVFVNSRALLFYYQNRLEGYGLEAWSGLTPGLDKWHRNVWRG